MNSFNISAIMASIVLFSGCATENNRLVLDRVGPSLASPSAGGRNGSLLVFTAFDPQLHFTGVYRGRHTDYKILSENGALLREVHNDTETILEGPIPVELPAGNYSVIAHSNSSGLITIPVLVVTQKTTVLHLEGGAARPDKAARNQSNLVRLPHGQIVGWRAN